MRSLHLSVCVLNFCAPSPRIWIEFGLRIWIPTFGFPKHVECMCWVGICKSMFLCFYVFLSCHYDFLSGNLPVPKIIIIGFFGLWGLWFYDFTIFFNVNGQALIAPYQNYFAFYTPIWVGSFALEILEEKYPEIQYVHFFLLSWKQNQHQKPKPELYLYCSTALISNRPLHPK